MSFTLLITDISSPLGRAVEHELERENVRLITPPDGFDWASSGALDALIEQEQIQLIINMRGFEEAANDKGARALLESARAIAASEKAQQLPLIHFSSYLIFGDDGKAAHSEKDPAEPKSAAGSHFAEAETLLAPLTKAIILRLSWAIGPYGDNLLTKLLRAYLAGETVGVNRRLRGAPTTQADAARVAVAMAKQISCGADNWGVMHYCSGDFCTQEEFAEFLLQLLIQQQMLTAEPSVILLDEESSEEPLTAVLACRRVRDFFGVQSRSWRPSMLPLVKQWAHSQEP